ncbi:MAG: hypothetical protein HGJ97_12625, partial [Desulfosporosinus sp.]|nr:hypothetical protein [Desulfosporosinus sp.]
MKNSRGIIVPAILWAALILISYYFVLVPINIQSGGFWIYVSTMLLLGAGLFMLPQVAVQKKMIVKNQL